jgi:hypothetical protein
MDDGVFNTGFAGAGLSHQKTQTALVAMDFQNVKNLLLMR